MHAAAFGDPSQVVSRQVNEHHVLGVLLRVRKQFLLQGHILPAGRTARPRSRDGPERSMAVIEAHQRFGRRARYLQGAGFEEKHVR